MVVGSKYRKWLAFMSVSASGPEFSPVLEQRGRLTRPRVAADLRYTTADVDFLESNFRQPNYDSGVEELHHRLRNPTREEFFSSLSSLTPWFSSFRRDNPDWDGGGFMLCYAGHGRNPDGALVFEDGIVTSTELVDTLADIAREVSSPVRLRVSAILDSCHSGALATELIDSCFDKYRDLLVPWMVYASCMEDEVALEDSGTGHGLFTYCFSVKEDAIGSFSARAIQPDNTFGPSLAIAKEGIGCSFLTAGAQNPVIYFNGTGVLEVCNQSINLIKEGDYIGLEATREMLKQERDKIAEIIKPVRSDVRRKGPPSNEEEERERIRETLRFLEEHSATTEDSS